MPSPTNRNRAQRARRIALLAATVALAASTAAAHDFFLLPQNFTPVVGQSVSIDATVSAGFPKLETVVTTDRMAGMQLHSAGKSAPLAVVGAGAQGRLTYQTAFTGDAVAAVSLPARDVEYPAERIELILGEYDIVGPAAAAVRALPKEQPLKVSSSRFAKTVLCVTNCGSRDDLMRPTGLDLEFIAAGAGAHDFVLISAGKPLPNHPVAIGSADGKRHRLTTDARGAISVPTEHRGMTMLFAALMTPPVEASGRFSLKLSSLTFKH